MTAEAFFDPETLAFEERTRMRMIGEFENIELVCGIRKAVEALPTKPHRCFFCGASLPAGAPCISVTVGRRNVWTLYACTGCRPCEVVPLPAARSWRAFQKSVASAARPEDVPPALRELVLRAWGVE